MLCKELQQKYLFASLLVHRIHVYQKTEMGLSKGRPLRPQRNYVDEGWQEEPFFLGSRERERCVVTLFFPIFFCWVEFSYCLLMTEI